MGGRADGVGTDAQQLVVDGWILDRRLGAGSYGEVWRARRRHLDLVRALKLVAIGDDDAFDSWRQEISRLEELLHPNVVRFYDADLVSAGPYQGYAWIATELCEHSLASELHAGAGGHVLGEPEGERLVEQMLGALAAARSRDFVHRDVKPGNILRHASGVWKLCDFGTARLLPADGTHPLTRVIGTSPYMSSAALRGQQNHAADLYALGVTVHEALAGQLLHPRGPDMSEMDYAGFVVNTAPMVSPSLPRRWRTVVEALIGQYGPLDAAALASWFGETRGGRPPRSIAVTPTAMPSGSVRSNGSTSVGTSATEAVGPAKQYYVPAPADVSPEPPAPPPAAPAAARPVVPPSPPAPAQIARDWWSEKAAAHDPSGIVRRRAGALAIDLLLLFVLCTVARHMAIVATYERAPAEIANADQPCAEVGDQFADCYIYEIPGDRQVYVSATDPWAPDVARLAPIFLVFVVLQGRFGVTPGKLLRGLRVVGPDWRRPGMRRAFLRSAVLLIDGLPCFVPLLGLLVVLTRKDRRRLGDLVADTYVVPRSALRAQRAAVKRP